MRRLTTTLLVTLIASVLSGCIVVPDRHYHYRHGYDGHRDGGYRGR
ncbi:MAG TPA: hypothetical protein VGE47_02730 [Burkholderiaceae bacterium]